jgi:ribosomal protein L37AE/L43A
MPRAARAPHSSKNPEACPHCGSHVLTRRGTRKKKLEIVQLWRCVSCKKTFTPGPAAIRGKTYPLRTVLVPGLKLFDMKCAWFNEEEYSEFFPRTLFARKKG